MRVACILFCHSNPHSQGEFSYLAFAEACLRFSPQIAIRKADAVFIEIEKCKKLYSEASFVARLNVLLRRFNFQSRVAISNDIPSALALARYGVDQVEQLPVESLDDFGDPFGQDTEGRKSIAKMIDALKRLGIRSVRQFKEIPISTIPSRFSGIGLYCRQRLEDASTLPWPYWSPPEVFLEKLELLSSEHCAEIEPLLFKAKEMFDRLFSRLRGRVLRAEKIRFSIQLERYSTIKTPVREWVFEFIVPQGSTLGFLPILRERLNWDLSKTPIESYVIAMSGEVISTALGQNAQRDLFHSRDNYEEAMGSLFGQLQEYLGKNRVFWAKTTEERFPEKSWVKTPEIESSQAEIAGRYPCRPTRIFRSPVPVTVIQDRVVVKGKVFKSIKWSSVERLSMEWLNDVPARNYYRVDLEGGRAIWIFSDPSHHYFAHGYFE